MSTHGTRPAGSDIRQRKIGPDEKTFVTARVDAHAPVDLEAGTLGRHAKGTLETYPTGASGRSARDNGASRYRS